MLLCGAQNTAPPPVRPSIPESEVFDSIASANAALAAAQVLFILSL
jgi:hypothetical protein